MTYLRPSERAARRAAERAAFKDALTERVGWLRERAIAALRALPPPSEPARRARGLAAVAHQRRAIANYLRVRRNVDAGVMLLRTAAEQVSVTAAWTGDDA